MRPHDVSGACGHTPSTAPSPCRRPSVGPARHPAGGNRLATGPGTWFATPSAAIPRPRFASRRTAVEVPASRGKLRRSRPGEQFRHPLGGLFFNPGFASRRGKTCVPRKSSGRRRGNGSPPPSAGCSFRLGLADVEFPTCRPRVLTHPIRYPTASLISIGWCGGR